LRKLPLPELALFGMTAAWGLSFVGVPRVLESCPVMTSIAIRTGIGVVCLLALRPRAFAATRLEWRAGILGGLLLAGGYVLQTAGLTEATPGKSGFLTAFYVTLVPAFEAAVYRRLPPRRDLAALAVATAGIAVMVIRADLTMSFAEGVVALAALCWAAHIVVVGRVAERVDPVRLAAIQMLVLVAAGTAGAVAQHDASIRWSGELVAWFLFLGAVTNALGFLVQAWGQKRVPPTRTAVLFCGEPVFAAMFGVWLAGETFGARDVLGASLVMGAVALTVLRPGNVTAPGAAGS
jgi:drug/metabolite transporter (DMT)-like permease